MLQTFRYRLGLIILRNALLEEGTIQINLVWSFLQCDHQYIMGAFDYRKQVILIDGKMKKICLGNFLGYFASKQ
jgi:hypothetical protein